MKEIELLLRHVMDLAIVPFESIGVFVILITGVRGVWDYIKHNPQIRLNFTTGMALGLESKLSSEVLHTIMVRELAEIATAATITALRTALTFLVHWEIKVERTDEEMQHHHEIPEEV